MLALMECRKTRCILRLLQYLLVSPGRNWLAASWFSSNRATTSTPMKPLALVYFLLASISVYTNAADRLDFVEVSAGVFVFEGEIKDIFASKEGMVSNVTFVIGKKAVAHVHLDHIFGNQAFVADVPEFIVHKNFQQELAAKGAYFQSRMQTAEFAGSEIVEATRLISKTETINLVDRPIKLIAAQRAHTNHDLMVYDINTAT